MKARIVDENVAIVANDVSKIASKEPPECPQADKQCRLNSVRMLRKIVEDGVAVIDNRGDVILKYRKHLSYKGQPGVGDSFYKHLVDNRFNAKRVLQVRLPKDGNGDFRDFPSDQDLKSFDHDDRIYVALVRASKIQALITNAVDSDYKDHLAALQRNKVFVEELCPNCLKPKSVTD